MHLRNISYKRHLIPAALAAILLMQFAREFALYVAVYAAIALSLWLNDVQRDN